MERAPLGPVKLPSGKEVHFVEPLGRDRMDIMARAIAEGKQTEMMFMLTGYWLPAKCLTDAQGKFLGADPLRAFDDWSDLDVQFYRNLFDNLFGWNVDREIAAKAEAARFLPMPATSSASSPSTEPPPAQ